MCLHVDSQTANEGHDAPDALTSESLDFDGDHMPRHSQSSGVSGFLGALMGAGKRLSDINKWEDPFFSDLPQTYKLLWLYILDRCDMAGVWKVNDKVARIHCGDDLDLIVAKDILKDRIEIMDGGSKWFIKKFIQFQYGILSNSPVHQSVRKALTDHGLDSVGLGYAYSSHRVGPTLKAKAEVKAKAETKAEGFDEFWILYPRKVGKAQAEKAYMKALKTMTSTQLIAGVTTYNALVKAAGTEPQFILHASTWLNGKRWEDKESPSVQKTNEGVISSAPGKDYGKSGRW